MTFTIVIFYLIGVQKYFPGLSFVKYPLLLLGYGLIFIAGLFNDVVLGIPIGISSLAYLLLCGAAAYLRNITLRPSIIKDWIFFFLSVLVINSLSFIILNFIFNYKIIYLDQLINIGFTFFLYLFFSHIFNFFEKYFLGKSNVG